MLHACAASNSILGRAHDQFAASVELSSYFLEAKKKKKKLIGSTASHCQPVLKHGKGCQEQLVATPKRLWFGFGWFCGGGWQPYLPEVSDACQKKPFDSTCRTTAWIRRALANGWYHTSLHLSWQQKLVHRTSVKRTNKHWTSVWEMTMGRAP